MFASGRFGWTALTVMVGFVFGWWDVSDRFEDPAVVEPVDPFQGGIFDVVESSPWSSSIDDFGLVEAVDCLSHSVIERISDRTDRRFDAGGGEPFAVTDRQILRSSIRVMDQTGSVTVEPVPQGLFQRIECETSLERLALWRLQNFPEAVRSRMTMAVSMKGTSRPSPPSESQGGAIPLPIPDSAPVRR